jgi:prepilin-type N-terminal cleavage/methylation domain-containing protein
MGGQSKMNRNRGRASNRGFSLVELIVVLALIGALVASIVSLALRSQRAQTFAEKNAAATLVAQATLDQIRRDVGSSTRLFQNDSEGNSYLAGMDLTGSGVIIGKLPKIVSDGIFEKEVSTDLKTGNVLFFVRQERTDRFDRSGSGDFVRTDIYRFILYALRLIPGKDPNRDLDAFDLVRWVSPPVADLSQIESITDPLEQETVCAHLFAGTNPEEPTFPFQQIRYLWKPGADFSIAFESLQFDGKRNPVASGFQVPRDPQRTDLNLLSTRSLAISTNLGGAPRGIGAFGILDPSGDGFPHGFEVQVVGPASARQVLAHLVFVNNVRAQDNSKRVWINFQTVVETRDL